MSIWNSVFYGLLEKTSNNANRSSWTLFTTRTVATIIAHKARLLLHPGFLLSPGFIDPVNIIARKVTVFNCLCFLSWGRVAALLGGLEILSCDVKPCPSERLLTLFNMSSRFFFFYEHYANEMVCIMREPYVPQRHARLQTAGSNLSLSVTYQPWHPCHFP